MPAQDPVLHEEVIVKNEIGKGDPNRFLTLKLRPYVDHDALLNAVADNLAYDPNKALFGGTSWRITRIRRKTAMP